MQLYYNTNGLAHHHLDDALDLLVDAGYAGVSLTPDVGHLDLLRADDAAWRGFAAELRARDLGCVLELGARFVLDPGRKHWPNLVTADEAAATRRVDFYRSACDRAAEVGASVVSLWSGVLEEDASALDGMKRLLERLPRVLDHAKQCGVTVGFEPEPGMLIDDLAADRSFRAALGRDDLGMTLDLGHLRVSEAGDPQEHIAGVANALVNVHLDDAVAGVHEHLPLGHGTIDFPACFRALHDAGYRGPVSVELSRDSHRAADAVRESATFVRDALTKAGLPRSLRA